MGMHLLHKSCMTNPAPAAVQPNPALFKILRTRAIGRFVVVDVQYPNCTNFEGRKILLMDGLSEAQVLALKTLDPHFAEFGKVIARFLPTAEGWRNACHVARLFVSL